MAAPIKIKVTADTDQPLDYEQVFQKYLEICNQAIEQNKNKFPYTEIWGSRFKALETEATLDAIIYDDRPYQGLKLTQRFIEIRLIMSKTPENQKSDDEIKHPRVKGVGDPDSLSQDADRHRKKEHQKSEK